MNQQAKGSLHHDAIVAKLKQKYLERKKKTPPEDIISGTSPEAAQRLNLTHRSKRQSHEWKSYSKALNELFTAVTNHPKQFGSDHSLRGSKEDLSRDFTAPSLQDSQVMFTETDVTLPSCLDSSPGSHESESDRELLRAHQLPNSCRSSSLVLANIYQEMMIIYEQLKAERQGQQQWERELHQREMQLRQHEEAVMKLAGLEMLHTRILTVEEPNVELSQLQDLLREKSKENRRLRSSFDAVKEVNDNMKKQLNKISEQNKKLESQSKRVQARLENLQRKYEHSVASRACQKESVKSTEYIKPAKKERTAAPGKPNNKASSNNPMSLKLLALLMEWLLDGQMFSSVTGNEGKSISQCLPLEVVLNDRCLKVLPLLADQLHHTPSSEPDLLLSLLRLIHWALRYLDNSAQIAALSATLRRIGEEVSKSAAQSAVLQSEDTDLIKSCSKAARPFRNRPLYRSSCPHTRILSSLIILRTVTQADVLAQALDSLYTELTCEESRGLFIHYGGVFVLLTVLRSSRGGLHIPIDILMELTQPSRYLNPFLETCSCEEFFRTASHLLKQPHLELPSLEKLSILLQKLSSIRKNRRLFELSSLRIQIQELYHKTDHTHTFLCLNLRSILHNLK